MADDVREQPRGEPVRDPPEAPPVVSSSPRVQLERPRCPFCHEGVEPDVPKAACDACMAWHHRACWEEGGGCGACGARSSAVAAAARPAIRVAPAAGVRFQDSAQDAVSAHRASAARARRPRAAADPLGTLWARAGAGSIVFAAVLAVLAGESGQRVAVGMWGLALLLGSAGAFLLALGLRRRARRRGKRP